jgi:YfiH family protein
MCKNNFNKIKYLEKRTTSYVDGVVPYISIDAFSEYNVNAVFSTRIGGVSEGQFTSMNFCTTLGDSIENVRENFKRFGKATRLSNFVVSKQTHTTNVRKVTVDDVDKGIYKELDYDNVDGLVTNEKNITLSTFYADCVPLYFYDPIENAIGLSHAGWKGTVCNIAKETLKVMNEEYGTKTENVVCAIGPSICVNCYEVSGDVAEQVINKYCIDSIEEYTDDVSASNMTNIIYKKSNGKYMLNLWAANYRNMLECGILKENIYIPDICTCENKEILFSHRGLNGKRGNLGAFMMIK